MALPTLQRSDFTGSILVNWQTERFEQYIAEQLPTLLKDSVGESAYAEIVATNLDKWDDLLNATTYDLIGTESPKKGVNDGVVNAIKYFLFSVFMRDYFVPTNAGMTKPKFENSDRLGEAEKARLVQNRWNFGVSIMHTAKQFVDNYRDFSKNITGFVDNGGGSFTIQTDSTKYLYNSDTVSISGVEYSVSNVVENTSFDIVSNNADFFSGVYTHSPYRIVCLGNLDAMV